MSPIFMEVSAPTVADLGITADTFTPVISILTGMIALVVVAGMGYYALKTGAKMLPKMLGWFVK